MLLRNLLMVLVLSAGTSCAAVQSAQLTLGTESARRVISPLLFGSNIQWEHAGDGALLPGANGRPDRWFPGLVDAAREARVSILRFPGGDLTNTYRWKNGLGKREQRPDGLSYSGKAILSIFGIEEFNRLRADLGVGAVLSVNLAAGADEAADWVEYMNGPADSKWGKRRAQSGFVAPMPVRYWEIGNEIYNPNQHGHVSAMEYGRKIIEFVRKMRARDPKVRIGAHLEASFLQAAWMPAIYPHMATWNEEVLKIAGREIDFAILHFYVPHDELWNERDLARLVWAGPLVFEQNLLRIRSLLKQYARPEVELALTEYGTYFGEKLLLSRRIASTEGALFNALMLMTLIRDGGFAMANHWSLINNSRFGMLEATAGQTLLKRPTYAAFSMIASLSGMTYLPVHYAGPGYRVQARGNVSALPEVPLLDAIAGRDDATGKISMIVVNRSPDEAVEIDIAAPGRTPRDMAARSLFARGAYEMQFRDTGVHPLKKQPNGTTRYLLPANSITHVELR